MTESLMVTVRNKTDVYFHGQCLSVSMNNEVGPFDVLPEHANFITIVSGEVVTRDMSKKTWKTSVTRGVVRVAANEVEVLILDE